MGYKLAGYDVIGGVEIDPEMMAVYRTNHNPKHSYLMGVQEFKNIPNSELSKELFELDILDGSPPCSSFSLSGSREKAWGDKKKFREGQAHQVLDDLFFDFIAIAKKLQPKVVVAENVKGLIQGNARGYVKEIFAGFRDAGYECQLFLLNASRMGVPQARERTFFIARKRGDKLKLEFNEAPINVSDILSNITCIGETLQEYTAKRWRGARANGRAVTEKGNTFGFLYKLNTGKPCATVTANGAFTHWDLPNFISDELITRIQSFPDDYNFNKLGSQYLCGMSVPPFMMQRVADQIAKQWFTDLGEV